MDWLGGQFGRPGAGGAWARQGRYSMRASRPRRRLGLGILGESRRRWRCAPHRGGVAQLVRALPCHGRGRGFESRRSRHSLYVRTPAPNFGVVVVFEGCPGAGRPAPTTAGTRRQLLAILDQLRDGLKRWCALGDDRVRVVANDNADEHGLVDEPTAGRVERLVEDLALIQQDQRVRERQHHVFDLARCRIGPLLGLGALLLDALLLGLENLRGYTAVVVELDELLLL
jgi:hypothetical protein